MNDPHKVCTIWLTGPSGVGASAIARELADQLRTRGGSVEILDEPEVRQSLNCGFGISRADQDRSVRSICYMARLLNRNGVTAVVSANSSCPESQEENRPVISDCVKVDMQNTGSVSQILSAMEHAGYLAPGSSNPEGAFVYSSAEEEIVRQRLEDLGYL